MKFQIIILIFSFNSLFSYSQEKVIGYYDNGNKKYEGFVIDNKLDSVFISYYENGKIKEKGLFRECDYKTNHSSILSDPVCGYERIDDAIYEGKKHGEWISYSESGFIKKVENFCCNIKQGIYKEFSSKGILSRSSFHSEGKEIQSIEYNPEGSIIRITHSSYNFEKGDDNEDYIEIQIDNISEFYTTGELESRYTESENGYENDYFEYWKNGFPKLKGQYLSGMKNGIFEEYDESGNIIFEGEYSEDIPINKHYYFDVENDIITVKEWDKGQLVKEYTNESL